jgi:hypothetical protein
MFYFARSSLPGATINIIACPFFFLIKKKQKIKASEKWLKFPALRYSEQCSGQPQIFLSQYQTQ